jgi:hypothetical protein
MPMTANIIHTMKHTVNAMVLIATTDHCFVFFDATMLPFTQVKNRWRFQVALNVLNVVSAMFEV